MLEPNGKTNERDQKKNKVCGGGPGPFKGRWRRGLRDASTELPGLSRTPPNPATGCFCPRKPDFWEEETGGSTKATKENVSWALAT